MISAKDELSFTISSFINYVIGHNELTTAVLAIPRRSNDG